MDSKAQLAAETIAKVVQGKIDSANAAKLLNKFHRTYGRAVRDFFDWCDQHKNGPLIDIEAIQIAADAYSGEDERRFWWNVNASFPNASLCGLFNPTVHLQSI